VWVFTQIFTHQLGWDIRDDTPGWKYGSNLNFAGLVYPCLNNFFSQDSEIFPSLAEDIGKITIDRTIQTLSLYAVVQTGFAPIHLDWPILRFNVWNQKLKCVCWPVAGTLACSNWGRGWTIFFDSWGNLGVPPATTVSICVTAADETIALSQNPSWKWKNGCCAASKRPWS